MGYRRKSTYSDGTGGNCIETASNISSGKSMVLVRDTTNRDGATLAFSVGAWQAFTAGLEQADGHSRWS